MSKTRRPAGLSSRWVQRLNVIAVRLVPALLAICGCAPAQSLFPSTNLLPGKSLFCRSQDLSVPKQLTFKQRSCWYASDLLSPWVAVRASASVGFNQWRNENTRHNLNDSEFMDLFARYYVRRSARETGELLAGYLNHEDPRPHFSGETAFGKRFKSAVLSVLVTKDDAGSRPAWGPLVGSFGSAFAGDALSHYHSGPEYAVRSASLTYTSYFSRALYREFRPEISSRVHRLLHK